MAPLPMANAATSSNTNQTTLIYNDGIVQFRLRLITSLLTRRPLLLTNIRTDDTEPGLRDYEASFLRLIDKLTNGTTIEINDTGTRVKFRPGTIVGGRVEHVCAVSRGVGWFLEPVMGMAMFAKMEISLTLHGVTNGFETTEPSIDFLHASFLPLLLHFGIGSDSDSIQPSIKINKRGSAPLGEGTITFNCPIIKALKTINLTDPGMIKRVRGVAVACKLPPTSTARVAHSAKGVLNRLLPDVWIATDSISGGINKSGQRGCGPSPGLKVVLSSESTTGVIMSHETCMEHGAERGSVLPEDLGVTCSVGLLQEVSKGGCVDTITQSFVLMLMCLCPEDVSRVRLGRLSDYTVKSLRLYKSVFGVEFKVKPDETDKTVVLSCVGMGFKNYSRRVT